jgi:hypothetical protein
MGQSWDEIRQDLAERLCWARSTSVTPYAQIRSQNAWTYQPSLRRREIVASRTHVPKAAHQDGEGGMTFEPMVMGKPLGYVGLQPKSPDLTLVGVRCCRHGRIRWHWEGLCTPACEARV